MGVGLEASPTRTPTSSTSSSRGGILSFDELTAEPPRPDEQGDGWDDTETTRFGRYAVRLWNGLLQTEAVFER